MIHPDTELALLESVGEAESSCSNVTQRQLAVSTGVSLGMTNALLRRLAQRGWLRLTRLSAKSMRYALTPEGVGEIARRRSGYFHRAAQNADKYRVRIEKFVVEAKRGGISTIVLAGASGLDFLLEFVCERHGIAFVKTADAARALSLGRKNGVRLLYSELEQMPLPSGQSQGDASLKNIIGLTTAPAVIP